MATLETLKPTDAAALLRDGLIFEIPAEKGGRTRYRWTGKARAQLGMLGPDERAALGETAPLEYERVLAEGD